MRILVVEVDSLQSYTKYETKCTITYLLYDIKWNLSSNFILGEWLLWKK